MSEEEYSTGMTLSHEQRKKLVEAIKKDKEEEEAKKLLESPKKEDEDQKDLDEAKPAAQRPERNALWASNAGKPQRTVSQPPK
jgi:hypothetical protein